MVADSESCSLASNEAGEVDPSEEATTATENAVRLTLDLNASSVANAQLRSG